MGEAEEATLRTLTAYRQVTDALILQHRGRVVDPVGDSILAEFASVVDAVRCAVEIQVALRKENAIRWIRYTPHRHSRNQGEDADKELRANWACGRRTRRRRTVDSRFTRGNPKWESHTSADR